MSKFYKKHRRPSLSDFQPKVPTLDIEEFNALTDVLYECLNENNAACARLLGVSRNTWLSWNKKPPRWPYWNIIIRHILSETLSQLQHLKGGIPTRHRQRVVEALTRVPHTHTLQDQIATLTLELKGAERALRRALAAGPLPVPQVYTQGDCKSYARTTIRTAARALGIVKETRGFGEKKKTFWHLPTYKDTLSQLGEDNEED